jgi:menaquinone-dependent protoporphyrinogen oxidase
MNKPASPAPRVLVAYASKLGSTRDIAETVGETIRDEGLEVDVRAAAEVEDLSLYGAVVLGSALYSATWLREANRFARDHAEALQVRPVWLFSSGPLDHSADKGDLPVTTHVAQATNAIGAREHRTFGGRLIAGTPGLDPKVLQTHRQGDFRDWDAIHAWARSIAAALKAG